MWHPIHARCVLSSFEGRGASAPLVCGAARCEADDLRRDNLEAAVQADPGLRGRAERLIGELADNPSGAPMLTPGTKSVRG